MLVSDFREIIELSPGTISVPPQGYGGSERMIFGLSKSLATLTRVRIVNFGIRPAEAVVDNVAVSCIKCFFRIQRDRGVITYNWNALISGLAFFFAELQHRTKRDNVVIHFHQGMQFTVYWCLKQVFMHNARQELVFSLHSPKWMKRELMPKLHLVVATASELVALRVADFATVESVAVARGVSISALRSGRHMVLPNGVDTSVFRHSDEFSIMGEGILYAARIREQKDQLTVVRAMSRLKATHSGARLLLLGDAEDQRYYKRVVDEVRRLELDEVITFAPSTSIEELNQIRSRYPIHLVYSSYTGFDVAVGETLSFGVATVLSDIPTLKGVVTNGVDCVLVPPQNAESLADALEMLLDHPEVRKRLGDGARRTALTKLDWNALAGQFYKRIRNVH